MKKSKKFELKHVHEHVSLMPNVILMCFSDLGKNKRLLNYARTITSMQDMHVYLIGYDISNIPLDILNLPNISIIYLSQFYTKINILNIIFFPILCFIMSMHLIGIFLSLPKINFLIFTINHLYFDLIPLYFSNLFKKTKIFLDVDSFLIENDKSQNKIKKYIENCLLKKAFSIICSTKAKQMILAFRGLKSTLAKNIPPRYNDIVNRVFNQKEPIVGILTTELEIHELNICKTIIKEIEKKKKIVHFHIFCSNKSYNIAKDIFKDLELNYTTIKYFNVNSKTYFNDLQFCYISLIPHQNPVLNITNSILDMIGAGVPVITERSGCITEIIKDNENGFLYDDNKEIIQILMKLFENEDVLKMRSKLLSLHDSIIQEHKYLFTKIINSEELPFTLPLFS